MVLIIAGIMLTMAMLIAINMCRVGARADKIERQYWDERKDETKTTNREGYVEEIPDIACSGDSFAAEKDTGRPVGCDEISCRKCLFNDRKIGCNELTKHGQMKKIHITVKQGIDNCYLAHQYEHPGYEDDRCAGLRTGNGGGEPIDECKECALYYGNREI
nr:MAG TPA: hypothetical protein [Caudoviricetes sp.]